MADVIPFRRPSLKDKHKGKTLCLHGHHKWVVDKNRQFDVKPVVSFLDLKAGGYVSVSLGRGTGQRVIFVPVPRADNPAPLDLPVAERPSLVGAMVVEGPPTIFGTSDGQRPIAYYDRSDVARLQVAGINLVPLGG